MCLFFWLSITWACLSSSPVNSLSISVILLSCTICCLTTCSNITHGLWNTFSNIVNTCWSPFSENDSRCYNCCLSLKFNFNFSEIESRVFDCVLERENAANSGSVIYLFLTLYPIFTWLTIKYSLPKYGCYENTIVWNIEPD